MQSNKTCKHKFLFLFSQFWDGTKDGILSLEDIDILAEVNAKAECEAQGKVDVDGQVLKYWTEKLHGTWAAITKDDDLIFNEDGNVDADEWLKYFVNLRQTVANFNNLPEWVQNGVPDYFRVIDAKQDGKICLADYKKFWDANGMDLSQAEPRFKAMLNDNDKKTGNVITPERFKELMLLFYTTSDPNCPGNYCLGQYDKKRYEQLYADLKVGGK